MNNRLPGIYIMTNRKHGTIYLGMAGHLPVRISQHGTDKGSAFCKRHNLTKCVYYELCATAPLAIMREKQLKGASRHDKIKLIESMNPQWDDLSHQLREAS